MRKLATMVWVALMMTNMGLAAETREAALLWRGVQEFDKAKVENSTSSAVRRPGTVGEMPKNAIFLHPPGKGRATLDFPPVKVSVETPSRLFLLAYAGMSDGIPWDDKERTPDGARFYVAVDRKELAQAYVRESRWAPLVADLGPVTVGKETNLAIQLATDNGPNGSSNYDWALLGEPVLVALSDRPLSQQTASQGVSGILIVSVREGKGRLVVEGLDEAGNVVKAAAVSEEADGPGLKPVSFDFAAVEDCVAWRWRAEGLQTEQAWGGTWPTTLEVTSVSPSQAVTAAGEPVRIRVGVTNKGMGTLVPADGAVVECEGRAQPVARLAPGETKAVEFALGSRAAGDYTVQCGLKTRGVTSSAKAGPFFIWPPLPALEEKAAEGARVLRVSDACVLMENQRVRWLVNTQAPGLAALVWVWNEGKWQPVGSASPLVEMVDASGAGEGVRLTVSRAEGEAPARLTAEGDWKSAPARVSVELSLPAGSEAVEVTVKARAEQPVQLGALRGPAVHVGDRCTGAKKGVAIFPGLEYLEGDEASSSTRDLAPPLNLRLVPHKFKVTVPMMMVETQERGPAMAIIWDPRQMWDSKHDAPAACFASPNFVEQQDNHLMQLFAPSVEDADAENKRTAPAPIMLDAGKELVLRQFIVAGVPSPDATGTFAWLDRLVGLPNPEPLARRFEDEMALSRHGFLKTVWDEKEQKQMHTVGGHKANAPGFATLMLMDGRAVAKGEDKRRVMERVKLIAEKTLREQGAGGLTSAVCCHIMGGEFPYHWGHLPEALEGLRAQAYGTLDSQEEDGGWGFHPDKKHSKLGADGARVSGICAHSAYILAKYAAISGDPVVMQGLMKALERLRRFKLPRGAQGWECPIMEPDVLASAYAVRAFVWAHMATGDPQWLDDARYWARTGLAFQYAWDDGEHPGMRYASIPVFGSTHFTHSWIGLPVQWCGLVYAYALQELMRSDHNEWWRKQAEGMTASVTYQQWPMDDEKLAGSYPDSWGKWFTKRNPTYINPEDIVVNLLALKGLDPGLRSAALKTEGGAVHVTAPSDVKAEIAGQELKAEMKYVPNETFYATIAPVVLGEEAKVVLEGEVLPRRPTLGAGETGCAYDPALKVLAVGMKANAQGLARLTISPVSYSAPDAPRPSTGWEFEKGAEGWSASHSCGVKGEDGRMIVTVTGPDPYAVSGPAGIPADTCKVVKMRVRMSGGNQIALFWRSNRSPAWGPDKHMTLEVPGDGQWREVAFDLSQRPLWAGKIIGLRLDPEPAEIPTGTTLEVDWIRPDRIR